MSLDVEGLSLTDKALRAIVKSCPPGESSKSLVFEIASAQYRKLAWGLWDMLYAEVARLGQPVSWCVYLSDLADAYREAGMERPEEG